MFRDLTECSTRLSLLFVSAIALREKSCCKRLMRNQLTCIRL